MIVNVEVLQVSVYVLLGLVQMLLIERLAGNAENWFLFILGVLCWPAVSVFLFCYCLFRGNRG